MPAPRAALAGLRNVSKSLLLVALLAALFAGLGWLVDEVRGASLFGLCSLLAAIGAYALGDRALLGMLGARPLLLARIRSCDRPPTASPRRSVSRHPGSR